jgi:hypothetical protein
MCEQIIIIIIKWRKKVTHNNVFGDDDDDKVKSSVHIKQTSVWSARVQRAAHTQSNHGLR